MTNKPTFIGKRWSLECSGNSGYVTCAISAKTKAYGDPKYPETDLVVPKQIEQRIRAMMRREPKRCLVTLPFFPGFYESDLSGAIDREEEMDAENQVERESSQEYYPEDYQPEHLRISASERCEIYFRHTDYQRVYLKVAQFWVEAFDCWCKEFLGTPEKSFAYESMVSPREYNFTTDRVLARVSVAVIESLFEKSKAEEHKTLAKVIKDTFTSYDGFISFYSNNIEAWLEKPLSEWDYNELGTLVAAAVKSSDEFGSRADFSMHLYEGTFTGNNEEGEALDAGRDWPKIEQAIADLRAKKLGEHNNLKGVK